MARAKEFKLYVDTTNGHVFQKPVSLAGVPFTIKDKFYEITPEQAERLAKGVPLRDVLREGVRKKVETDLDEKLGAATDPGADVETLKTHKELDAFAAEKGLEFPADVTTIPGKKDFIKTALLG